MSLTGSRMVNLRQMMGAIKSKKVVLVYRLEFRTTPGIIRSYFENYGPVEQVYRGINIQNGSYIGPGLVEFKDEKTVEDVMMQRQHNIDTKEIVVNVCNFLPLQIRKHAGWQTLRWKPLNSLPDNKILD